MTIRLDDARTFLERVLPWPPLGSADAYFNIHYPVPNPRGGKPFWNGIAVETLDDAVRQVRWVMTSQKAIGDVYVCMSSQRLAETRTAANGRTYRIAQRSQQGAVALRSLYLDIDVKEGAYHGTREAMAALGQFCKDTGLPRPSLAVQSGSGGLHVYWTLDEALTPAQWKPLADALAEATRRHGLICDTACTVDSARILRVPDTFNFKSNPPKPVTMAITPGPDYSVGVIAKALGTRPAPKLSLVAPVVGGMSAAELNAAAVAGIQTARPVILETARNRCGFLEEAFATGGAAFSEPLWHLSVLAATFDQDGLTTAHALSQGHPDYDPDTTAALYERKRKEREMKSLGWPSCQAIENAGCGHCATCPARAAGKSPLNLTKTGPAPSGAEDDLPAGYIRNDDGLVMKANADANGGVHYTPIMRYPMTDPWMQADPWVLHFTSRDAGNRPTQVSIPFDAFVTREGVGRHLTMQGLAVGPTEAKTLGDFFVSWTGKLTERRSAVVSTAPYGWVFERGKPTGFSYGGRVYGPTGDERPTASSDPVIDQRYTPCGALEPWLEASQIVTEQGRPALDVILATAFAAPLMRFTGKEGCVVSAFSTESGIGKSTAIKIAQAVWGSPQRAVQGLGDTQKSVANKLGILRHLPMYWDELKDDQQTAAFATFAFQITSGREISRLRADATQRDSGNWQTLLLAASNDSIVDWVMRHARASAAGIYRVWEFSVPAAPASRIEGEVSRLVGSLEENFGNAGRVYAEFLGKHAQRVGQEVAAFHDKLSVQLRATPDERFWIATMTVIFMGAHYANTLNLTKINMKALLTFMSATLKAMRDERKGFTGDMKVVANVESVVGDYLNITRSRNTIVTPTMPVAAGRPAKQKVLNDVSKLDALYVHVARDTHAIRVHAAHLKDWAVKMGYAWGPLVKELEAAFGMRKVIGRLGAGTDFSTATMHLLELDVAGTGLASSASDENTTQHTAEG